MAKYQQPLNTDINDRLTSAEYDSELQKWVTVSKDIQAIDKLQEVKNRLDQQLEVKDDNALSKLADLETKLQAIEDRLNQALDVQLTGSKAILAGEPKPAGKQNDTLLEYNTSTGDTKVYKYISGDWREL